MERRQGRKERRREDEVAREGREGGRWRRRGCRFRSYLDVGSVVLW